MKVPNEEGAWLRNTVDRPSPKGVAEMETDSQMEEAVVAMSDDTGVRLRRLALVI